jgi:hypothetical protein
MVKPLAISGSLLPSPDAPAVTRARGASSARAGRWDAMFVIVADTAQPRVFADARSGLPEPERWRELHSRVKPSKGSVRTTTLANSRHTLAVLGYLQADASPFERLALAGRMLKEASGRAVDIIALAAPGDHASGAASVEALLAAAFAHAFALPAFRSKREPRRPLREIVLIGGDDVDIRQASAAARGNNLTRWLTALPPNRLCEYRRLIAESRVSTSMRFSTRAPRRLVPERSSRFRLPMKSRARATFTCVIGHAGARPGVGKRHRMSRSWAKASFSTRVAST